MQNFQLSEFLKISGVGAASGLVYTNNKLYIISDSSGFLYEYDLPAKNLVKHSIVKNASENIQKKIKPDFEAITLKGKELHIFGSGSTENRNKQIIFSIDNSQFKENDLSQLYQNIKNEARISDDDFNIEGALFFGQELYLFQRGNGANSKNGIIKIDYNINNNLNSNIKIEFQSIQLPKITHVETSFTDAVLVKNKIYFLAAAEDTTSTYEDGEVLGSIIGCIDCETFKIDFTHQITDIHKFEGLTLLDETNSEIIFLLCEDNDTDALESKIYKLILYK
jgi:ABC-type antimicrobial peptide transport system permease subunit